MNDPETVGAIIKKTRIEKGFTQKELASLLFVEETTVSRWECGLGYPNMYLIDDICRVLEIKNEELLGTNSQQNKCPKVIKNSNTKRNTYHNIWLGSLIFSLSIILLSVIIILFTLIDFKSVKPSVLVFMILLLIICAAASSFSLVNVIFNIRKKTQCIWCHIVLISLLLFLDIVLIIFALLDKNTYFLVLAIACSFTSTIELIFYLASAKYNSTAIKVINFVICGFISLIIFGLTYLSVVIYAYIGSSTITYSVSLYFFIVICNIFAFLSFAIIFKSKCLMIISIPLFLLLNGIYVVSLISLLFGMDSSIFTILNFVVYLGIFNSPSIVLLPSIYINLEDRVVNECGERVDWKEKTRKYFATND